MNDADGSGAGAEKANKARMVGPLEVVWLFNTVACTLEKGVQLAVDYTGFGASPTSAVSVDNTVPPSSAAGVDNTVPPSSAAGVDNTVPPVGNVPSNGSVGTPILKPIAGYPVYNCETQKFQCVPKGCGVVQGRRENQPVDKDAVPARKPHGKSAADQKWVRRSDRNLQPINDEVASALNSSGEQGQPAGGEGANHGQAVGGEGANHGQVVPPPPARNYMVVQFWFILFACVTMAVMSFVFQPIYGFTVPQIIHFGTVVFELTLWFLCILIATLNLVRYAGLDTLTTVQSVSQILCGSFFFLVWYCIVVRTLSLMRSDNGFARGLAELTGYAEPQSTGLPSIGQLVSLVTNLGYTNLLQPTTVAKVVAIDPVTKVASVESAQFTLWPTVLSAWSVVSPYVADPNSWNLVSIPKPVVEAKTVVITKPGEGGVFWSYPSVNETVVVEEDMWTKMWSMTQWYVSHGVPKIMMNPIRFGSSLFTWAWTGLFYTESRGVKGHMLSSLAAVGVAIFPWCNMPISMFIGTACRLLGRRAVVVV